MTTTKPEICDAGTPHPWPLCQGWVFRGVIPLLEGLRIERLRRSATARPEPIVDNLGEPAKRRLTHSRSFTRSGPRSNTPRLVHSIERGWCKEG